MLPISLPLANVTFACRWSETGRKATGRRCPNPKTINPAEVAQAKRFDHQQRITQCINCMGRRANLSVNVSADVAPGRERSVRAFSRRSHRGLRIPRRQEPASLPLAALRYFSRRAFCSVPTLAPSMLGSTSEHGRFCSYVNARNIRERRLPSGAARTPGRVFREDPSDVAGTGSPICARGFVP